MFSFPSRLFASAAFFFALSFCGHLPAQTLWDFVDVTSTKLLPDPGSSVHIARLGALDLTSPPNVFFDFENEGDLATGDLNGDGIKDCIIVFKGPFYETGARSHRLLLNQGGTLADVTSTYASDFFDNESSARDVCIADIDGDGMQDVIVVNIGSSPQYYRNLGLDSSQNWLGLELVDTWYLTEQGNTRFEDDTPSGINCCAVACADIDNDGDIDIFLGTYNFGPANYDDRILINVGNGRFTEMSNRLDNNVFLSNNTTGAEFAYVDGDNHLDLVFSQALANYVAFNDGTGTFRDVNLSVQGEFSYMSATVEVDGVAPVDFYAVGDLRDNSGINNGDRTFGDEQLAVSRDVLGYGGNIHPFTFNGAARQHIGVTDLDVAMSNKLNCSDGLTFALLENRYTSATQPHFFDPEPGVKHAWHLDGVWDFAFLDVNGDGADDLLMVHARGISLFFQQ